MQEVGQCRSNCREHQQRRPGLLTLLLGMDAGHLLFYFPPINQLVDAVQFFQGYMVLDKGVA
jgi:hypothetical protein